MAAWSSVPKDRFGSRLCENPRNRYPIRCRAGRIVALRFAEVGCSHGTLRSCGEPHQARSNQLPDADGFSHSLGRTRQFRPRDPATDELRQRPAGQDASLHTRARLRGLLNPTGQFPGAPCWPSGGLCMTSYPARSRYSTSRSTVICAINSSALCMRRRPLKRRAGIAISARHRAVDEHVAERGANPR